MDAVEDASSDEWDEDRPPIGRQALVVGCLAMPFAMAFVLVLVGLVGAALAIVTYLFLKNFLASYDGI